MTVGTLLLAIVIAVILINAISLLVKLKQDKKSVDTNGDYFIASMVIAAIITIILISSFVIFYWENITYFFKLRIF